MESTDAGVLSKGIWDVLDAANGNEPIVTSTGEVSPLEVTPMLTYSARLGVLGLVVFELITVLIVGQLSLVVNSSTDETGG
jgi:hypothetical protein